jgi:hypothetical protein
MPVEHPAPASSEAHLHHSDGHSYRYHHTDARSHARSHATYMDGRTDGRSHHTSHSVALDHILMTLVRQPIPIMNRMTPRRATPHQDRVERRVDVGHVQHGILTNNLPSIPSPVKSPHLHVVQILFTITIAIMVRTTFPILRSPSLHQWTLRRTKQITSIRRTSE